ncbi:MAG: class I SAM-dependent methyltransferase [Gemmataceae bacterium]
MAMDPNVLTEQIEYYRARAAEYDEWFLRQGRYDRGDDHRRAWLAEVAEVEAALAAAEPAGDILELACGTGLWTRHLAPLADRLTAVDAAPEAVALNRDRVRSPAVEYLVADLFDWRPPRRYDFVFFGFWLSHVPPERFAAFWRTVADAVTPGGRVFFVDSLPDPDSTATDHPPQRDDGYSDRLLNDGRRFRIVKVFYDPPRLEADLHALGWAGAVRTTRRFFLHGLVRPA